MVEILSALVATAFIFTLLWIGFYSRKKIQDQVVSFVCSDCREMDCICHKVNDTPNSNPEP